MSDLLRKWLEHYDPIHRGWTPAGIANGVCATSGFSFPRIRGGYNLYREPAGVPGAGSRPVGAAGADADQVATFPWVTHQGTGQYVYRVVPVGGGGVSNWQDVVSTRVSFTDGTWEGLQPNSPSDLRVRAVAGGRFELRWSYNPANQPVAPSNFAIHAGAGGNPVDLDEPIGVVEYLAGQFHFAYTSEVFEHDCLVRWAVRAVSSQGVADRNTDQVTARAIQQPPPSNPQVVVRAI